MNTILKNGVFPHRAAYEDIVKHLERLREERGEERLASLDQKPRDLSSLSGTCFTPEHRSLSPTKI